MNTSEDRMVQLTLSLQMRERWLVVVECTAYFSVVLTAFMGNILFALTFYKIRTLRTAQNYYLVSLAVTDILNAAACSIALVALAEETWPYGYFICQLQGVIMSICGSVSTLTLGMIAINRYTKICRSRSLYQKIFSKRNVLTSIGISWMPRVHWSLVPFSPAEQSTFPTQESAGAFINLIWMKALDSTFTLRFVILW